MNKQFEKWTKWFAGFEGDEKVTAWYRQKSKAFSIMRQRLRERGGGKMMTVRTEMFFESR